MTIAKRTKLIAALALALAAGACQSTAVSTTTANPALLEAGADPSLGDSRGNSVWHVAAARCVAPGLIHTIAFSMTAMFFCFAFSRSFSLLLFDILL